MTEEYILECENDWILQEDLDFIANMDFPFEVFKNCTFLISGATGLIGSLLIKALLCCDRRRELNIRVLGLVRDINKAKRIYQNCFERSNLKFLIADLQYDKIETDEKIDYIIHTAAITNSKKMITKPCDTINTAINGTISLLNLAVEKDIRTFLYLSSMEIYGDACEKSLIKEQDLGYIDLENLRNCYPESKRMCECLCIAYANQYGLNTVSARLAQTFGAGVIKDENRVFAQFAKSVIENRDIVLHTTGKSEGNYCYSRDAIKALLLLLIYGKKGESYNISNERCHTTIKNMAELVASNIAGGKIKVVCDLPKNNNIYGYASDKKMKLDASKMRGLGWKPEVDLKEAYERMIESMRLY